MCPDSLLGRNMMNIRPRDSQPAFFFGSAACACAAGFDGTEILFVAGVFDVEDALGCDCVAEALNETKNKNVSLR